MIFLTSTFSGLGSALLPCASVLLLEELTYGGLVRLLLRPKPALRNSTNSGSQLRLLQSKVTKPYHGEGERKCSR